MDFRVNSKTKSNKLNNKVMNFKKYINFLKKESD